MLRPSIALLLTLATAVPAQAQVEEEVVDFEQEERRSDAERDAMMGGPSAAEGLGGAGIKLFIDLLADHELGERKFEFRPNHTYVFVQVSPTDDTQFLIHVSDAPIFFELTWNITARVSLLAGKLLIPFGVNDFHHVLGGRVDEESHFLPETWGDFGVGLHHLALDTEDVGLEYVLYAVNGFSGVEEPNVGAGTDSDNNWAKGLGTRTRLTLLRDYRLTASTYYDVWDREQDHAALFYALGGEARLARLRLRAEWGRGEIQVPKRRHLQGILEHNYARTGYFFEAQYPLAPTVALRLRTGRINPNNTETTPTDVEVYEPSLHIGLGTKLWWTLAYQFVTKPGLDWTAEDPADVIYAKLFLQY